jgi:glycosyltransferase involved in cell wall biosynthesis
MTPSAVALIPAYNCAPTIGTVVEGTLRHLPRVLVVSDGSTDATVGEALKAGAQVLALKRNRGKGRAVAAGLGALLAEGPGAVLFLDGDLQHDPARIPEFLALAGTHDLVTGVRDLDGGHVPARNRRTNRFFGRLFLKPWTGLDLPDYQCGYRLVSAGLLRRLPPVYSRYALESQMLVLAAKLRARVGVVHLEAIYNGRGSHFRPVPDTFHICMACLHARYAVRPLEHPLDPLSLLQ